MSKQSNSSVILPCLSLIILLIATGTRPFRFVDGAHRPVHVTDDLDDVVDDEEDESWREWGRKSTKSEFDPPPTDFSKMSPSQIQSELMKRQFGPVFGFVKLRPGVRRTKEMVPQIAMKWTNLARTGGIESKFTGFDLNTVMFNMEKGQDAIELKEFLLSQPEAYEVKIGDQLFRRPGDPPIEEYLKKLQSKNSKADLTSSIEGDKHLEL